MSHAAGTLQKVPPIHPIEIFADDETGSIFKSYPGHRVFARGTCINKISIEAILRKEFLMLVIHIKCWNF